jgi:nitroimidazol reductase NimA-like FMN-containing flavoprotein (pyridoxamine 5'-phosphate oxidase superfamily)
MTAADDFWLARSGGRVVPLDRALCLELLTAVAVGRVGYVTTEGPHILPVNYTMAEEHIVFRTLAYGEIAEHVLDQRVAFEVDNVDQYSQSGWSVLVTGRCELLTDAEMQRLLLGRIPDPWAGGPRTLFLKIATEQISGRQVLPAGAS